MATSPLQQTAAVFDESVLKVEFLQMPAQIPDFSLNLNTEALLYRFGLFMQNIIGPARISGFNLSAGATTIGVSTVFICTRTSLFDWLPLLISMVRLLVMGFCMCILRSRECRVIQIRTS